MRYAIIGCSAAGINAIEAIRSRDKKAKIIVVSDESRPLYSRCLISYLLAGTVAEDKIWYRPDSFFKENKAEAILGVKAEKINVGKKEVVLQNKAKVKFDKLLIATGASPKLENISGIDKKGVYPLRTIDHTLAICSMLDRVKSVVVLGGGLIGLRAAYALKNRDKRVSVFVRSQQVLSQIVDKGAASLMQRRVEEKGIRITTGRFAKKILGNGSVKGIVLDDDSQIDCELVIIGKGVSPNIDMAKEAGIKTNWGIIADDFLKTSHEDVFAAGDVSEAHDITLEENSINAIWPTACEQGRVAGLNMLEKNEAYDGSMAMNSIEFFGLPVISIGITRPKKDIYKEIVRANAARNIYKKIVLRDGVIVGAIFVNSVDTIGVVGALIRNKVDVTSIKDAILEENFDYGKIVSLIKNSKQGFKEREFKETTMTL